jgi:D-glycero-alpha-D-manno-heptose-7-phosphate kinase
MTGLIRARAPLRLGLAGGGTDVSPYCDDHGGAVLNVTIDRFAFASVRPRDDGQVSFSATDLGQSETLKAEARLATDAGLRLHRAAYNRIVSEHNHGQPLAIDLITHVDSPPGSGLGSSSALVVAMVQALLEHVRAPLGDYEAARLAFEIERKDLKLNGGRQDQYAAMFGGFNFIEFRADDQVLVNPLRLKSSVTHELEASLLLYFTGASRDSSKIIEQQSAALSGGGQALEAMHRLKAQAWAMKEALLLGQFDVIADLLNESWRAKRATWKGVSNDHLEAVIATGMANGATAAKVSGAGGGGFVMFLCDPTRRIPLTRALVAAGGGDPMFCQFTREGAMAWRVR